jgi:MFS family permease
MYLLIVIIASYTKSEYHASDSIAGLVSGLFIIGSLIGRFVTGKYVNKVGPKANITNRLNIFNGFSIIIFY